MLIPPVHFRSSGSSQTPEKADYSICVETAGGAPQDPLYLLLRSAEDKDKWLYFLKMAADDPALCGTPFEVLVQRLMLDSAPDSALWSDVLMCQPEERPTDVLTSIPDGRLRKKALENDLAAYLFSAVPMRPVALQYHVDLAQNILTTAMEHEPLVDELFAQLIRLTCSGLEHRLQAWKLLVLAIPLYLPRKYSLLWLLQAHLRRFRSLG